VRSVDWLEEDFSEFDDCIDADDAVNEWAKFGDSNSWFVDGYPDNHEVEVRHPGGALTRHIVSTDWSPDFCIYDKAAE
jgi:hypothetical protein